MAREIYRNKDRYHYLNFYQQHLFFTREMLATSLEMYSRTIREMGYRYRDRDENQEVWDTVVADAREKLDLIEKVNHVLALEGDEFKDEAGKLLYGTQK